MNAFKTTWRPLKWIAAPLVIAGFLIVVAYTQAPRDPWIQVDRTALSTTAVPGPTLTETAPLRVEIRVPELGIDRVDFRAHGTSTEAAGTMVVKVLNVADGRMFEEIELPIGTIPPDVFATVVIGQVDRTRSERIALEFSVRDMDPDAEISLWEAPCECIVSAAIIDPNTVGATRDLDMATFVGVDGRRERTNILMDRIDHKHPQGFQSVALICALIVSVVAFLVCQFSILWDASSSRKRKTEI